MDIQRKCIQCGKQFTITGDAWNNYHRQGYVLPKRCMSCRKQRRKEDAFFEDEIIHLVLEKELEKRRVSKQLVKHKHFDKPLQHRVKNLFMIGNGFDIWCGLNTRYRDFEEFYDCNKIQISWDLGIEPCELKDDKGNFVEQLTQFDLLYFVLSENYPTERDEKTDFWSDFENSLAELDDLTINMYFGKEVEDLKDIRLDCDFAYEIIRKTFAEWVKSIDCNRICVNDTFHFDESLFINFNYTDTLTRFQFGINENDVIHIHGKASDAESIIFGHGKRIETDLQVIPMGGRFAGGYIIETILKRFYKDPPARWKIFLQRLKNKDAILNEVNAVYILGHSLGEADKFYFKQIKRLLPENVRWHFSCFSDRDWKNTIRLIRELKIENYHIYPTIGAALSKFKA